MKSNTSRDISSYKATPLLVLLDFNNAIFFSSVVDPDPDRVRIILPDPDSYQLQLTSRCIFDCFPEVFNMLSKILRNMTPLPLMNKERKNIVNWHCCE